MPSAAGTSGRQVRVVDDAAQVARLRRAWTDEDAGDALIVDPDFDAEFAAWWERERADRTTWVAFADGVPVGMLNLAEFRRMPRPGPASGR